MTAEETTTSKYKISSQNSFIKIQYIFSAELYEAPQARKNEKGGFEEGEESSGCWMVDKSFIYWEEIHHYKNRGFSFCSIFFIKNENCFVKGFFILVSGRETRNVLEVPTLLI